MTDNTNKLSSSEWDSLIQEYQTSGLSVIQFSQKKELQVPQLRWQIRKRQIKDKKSQSIQWMPLQASSPGLTSPIIVKIGTAEISVTNGFNKEVFTEVIQSLLSIC